MVLGGAWGNKGRPSSNSKSKKDRKPHHDFLWMILFGICLGNDGQLVDHILWTLNLLFSSFLCTIAREVKEQVPRQKRRLS